MTHNRLHLHGIIGEPDADARTLGTFLAANAGPVDIVLNSPGGIASEGAAMLAELERHGDATVLIEGIAASAASLVAMGAREIVMHRDALMMLHDPSAISIGTAQTHRDTADTLEKMTQTYAGAYARASGNSEELVRAWMAAETWLNAEEAVALNFADRIEGGERTVAMALGGFDVSMFHNAPAQLLEGARHRGAAEPSEAGKMESTNA